MKKYLLLTVLCLGLSGCFVCRNSDSPLKDDTAGETETAVSEKDSKKQKPEVRIVEKIVTVKEKAKPSVTVSAGDFPLFDSGKATMTEGGEKEFKKIAKELKKDSAAMIVIVGHTDNTGEEEQNVILSQQRAKAVMDELRANGVENVIGIDGKGSSEPKVSNDTEEGRKINRRVEIFIRK